ncbi:MAG: EAL domain-containing protein [Egibacteraceae bacterium]
MSGPTESHRIERDVAQALLRSGAVAVLVLDAAARVRFANDEARRLLGPQGQVLAGRPLVDLVTIAPLSRGALDTASLTERPWSGACTLDAHEGGLLHAHLRAQPLPGRRGVRQGQLVTWMAIDADDVALAHRGEHDELTALANRAGLLGALAGALERVREPLRVAALVIDLDDFHIVNHVLGHAAGDLLLDAVGRRLERAVGEGATVARLRGDDFAVVAVGASGERDRAAEEAAALAERLSMAISGAYTVAGQEVFVTVRVGIALGDPARDAEAQLRDAEAAVVRAVQLGSDVELHAEQARVEAHQRLVLTNALRHSIPREELELVWQPEHDLVTGGVFGLEALVRWQHPERGLLTPESFLDTAEASGLIVPLGRWVLAEACRQAVAWLGRHPEDVSTVFAVNVAPRQLVAPGFVADVDAALGDAGLAPHRLTLEITESAILHDLGRARTALAGLSERGVQVAVDDFGTGYSSLSHLIELHVDMLKIDRSFVAHVEQPGATRTVVEAAVGLARTLGVTSIAEGVERASQAEALRRLDCKVGQGYLWSRPLPLSGLDGLVGHAVGGER